MDIKLDYQTLSKIKKELIESVKSKLKKEIAGLEKEREKQFRIIIRTVLFTASFWALQILLAALAVSIISMSIYKQNHLRELILSVMYIADIAIVVAYKLIKIRIGYELNHRKTYVIICDKIDDLVTFRNRADGMDFMYMRQQLEFYNIEISQEDRINFDIIEKSRSMRN